MIRWVCLVGLLGTVAAVAGGEEKPQPAKLWAGISASSPSSTSNVVLSVPEAERLMLGFAVINDGADPVAFRREETELLINGKPLAGLGDVLGEGPVWPPLMPGKSYSAALGMGKYFAKPGLYKIQWRGKGFESKALELRVVGE